MSLICRAIRTRRLLEFDYYGKHRWVAPYCHGVTRRGNEVVRAIQLRGEGPPDGFGFGKLWRVSEMSAIRITDEHFEADDPNYNPGDRAMVRIHCCIASPTARVGRSSPREAKRGSPDRR
ncbi:MAG TPA: hypothetical protein VE549_09785 [Myxococcaceae bacterium]|nr:hypothetical protein [Myxococcaceae bacterium]